MKPSSPTSELETKVHIVSDSSVSCSHYDDYFGGCENRTIGIGLKIIKKMGYEGMGLGVNF